ncbi:pyridoxamine 5'-phosphate oxidase family protein [Candidatus Kaiserbacteria bacterium]|nr:pyridoxamine 5'-phosphate oxidase family protein [Candidatus Kaiserbacteria bacterium]
MTPDMEKASAEALAFLKAHKAGVLATVSREGRPHASAVYYTCDDKFNIYFLTLASSRKYAAASANPWGAFVIGTQDIPQTLQIEGPLSEVHRKEDAENPAAKLIDVLTSNGTYYAPITKLDPADTVLMWLQPKWIRWADYTSPLNGDKNIFTEIPTDNL